MLREGTDYVARIETSRGPITIDLLEKEAPVAVRSFVFLAREGFDDNAVGWGPGYRLPDELDLAEREGYPIGTVTTAGSGAYTAGSGFYIAYGEQFDQGFETDRSQTTFGRVLSGMDVIETMTGMDRVGMGGEAYAKRLFMESVIIERR